MRRMLKNQLKGVPEDQQEKIIKMFENNPELFEKIAEEIKDKTNSGKDQDSASMEVMMKYKSELQKALNQ